MEPNLIKMSQERDLELSPEQSECHTEKELVQEMLSSFIQESSFLDGLGGSHFKFEKKTDKGETK